MQKLLLLLLLIVFYGNSSAQSPFLDTVKVKDKFLYIYSNTYKIRVQSIDGKVISDTIFKAASEPDTFYNRIWFKKDLEVPSEEDFDIYFNEDNFKTGWQLHDLNGNRIGDREFANPSKFYQGLAIVEDPYAHVMDVNGNVYLDSCFTQILRNPDNSFWAIDSLNRFHLFSTDFKIKGIYSCNNVSPMFPNGALLLIDSIFHVIDTNGVVLGALDEVLAKSQTNVVDYFNWHADWAPEPFTIYDYLNYNTWKDIVYNEYYYLNERNYNKFDTTFKVQLSKFLPQYMLFFNYVFSPDEGFFSIEAEPNYDMYYPEVFYYSYVEPALDYYDEKFESHITYCDSNIVAYDFYHYCDIGSTKFSLTYDEWKLSYLCYVNGDSLTYVSRRNCLKKDLENELAQYIYDKLKDSETDFKRLSFDQVKGKILDNLDSFCLYSDRISFGMSLGYYEYDDQEEYTSYMYFEVEMKFKDVIKYIDPKSIIYPIIMANLKD